MRDLLLTEVVDHSGFFFFLNQPGGMSLFIVLGKMNAKKQKLRVFFVCLFFMGWGGGLVNFLIFFAPK